jgi:hypothetical protein
VNSGLERPSHFFIQAQAQVELERRRILMEFKHLHQDLEEEENFLLSRLCWLGHEVATEVQLNSLRKLIDSLKATQQMPLRQMLRVSPLGTELQTGSSPSLVSGQSVDHLADYLRLPQSSYLYPALTNRNM